MQHTQPCKFFLSNSCKYGSACHFSHERALSYGRLCKYYKTGTCIFGKTCRDVHADEPIPDMIRSLEPCIFWRAGKCNRGDRCMHAHDLMESQSANDTHVDPRKQQPQLEREEFNNSTHDYKVPNFTVNTQRYYNQTSRLALPSTPAHDGTSRHRATETSFEQGEQEAEVPTVEPTTVDTVEQNFLGRTRATFQAGGGILEIQTAFESKKVILSNIPPQYDLKDLLPMAETMGNLKSITSPPSSTTSQVDAMSAELEYLDARAATTAAVALDGLTICSRRITAQLNLKSVEIGMADLRSSTLKVSWFAPSRVAYAHYDSIAEARHRASYFNGRQFNGRVIAATFQQPSFRQTCSFTVAMKGLPENFEEYHLKSFCKTQSIAVMTASYTTVDSIKRIQNLLQTYGPLESFDCSPPKDSDTKIRALARFVRAEDAATAVSKLHGRAQSFLGGVKTWTTLLHSIKYNINRRHFEALQNEIKQMQGVIDCTAKLRVYDKDERGNPVGKVCIRIYGEDPKGLAHLKRQLEGLLTGEEVVHEGAPLWDDCFESKEAMTDTEGVAGAFIRVDNRRKRIYISGSQENRKLAKKRLLDRLRDLRSDRRQIQLKKYEMTRVLRGGLIELWQLLGKDNLNIDVRNRVLTVICSEDKLAIIRTILDSKNAIPFTENEQNASECPVCLDRATEPVKLKCSHTYCRACLRQYLETSEVFPVNCFGDEGTCQTPIPIHLIRQSLGPQQESIFFERAFLTYVRQHPKDFHYCPTSDCKIIYRPANPGTVLRCFSCLARICAHCHIENHDGLTCEEYIDHNNGGEDSFKRWKADNNVHSCPECGANIDKYEGCNHVTCANCSTHMCWVCFKVFASTKIDGPDGIYAHMQREHGGIH